MLADELGYVIGVDPHRDRHALAVVRAPSGQVLLEATAAASSGGYRSVLRLAAQHAPGRRAFAIEGTGSYGKGLARFLGDRPIRASRRSAEWLRGAVDQAWKMKAPRIRDSERAAAELAYDQARRVYDRIISESPVE